MNIHHGRKPSQTSLAQFLFPLFSILFCNLSWLSSGRLTTICKPLKRLDGQGLVRTAVMALWVTVLFIPPLFAATTITTIDSEGDVGFDPSLVLSNNDKPIISYLDKTNSSLKVAVCGDTTCTINNTLTSVAVGNVDWYSSIKLNAQGYPVISYLDKVDNKLKLVVCGNMTCTANNTITSIELGGAYSSLVLNSQGYPVISYIGVNNNLKLAVCENATCIGNTPITVNTGGNIGWYLSLILNNQDYPIISYYSAAQLKLARCDDEICSTNVFNTVDNIGDVGDSSSIVLNKQGYPVISYFDKTNTDLKLVACGNATCTANNKITMVDDAGGADTSGAGGFTSLVLNSQGYPVISYFDLINRDLKLAVCGNADCTSGNKLTTVDSTGEVGRYSSLALNSQGNPVIGYYDTTNQDLKLAMCDNPTCSPLPEIDLQGNNIAIPNGNTTSLITDGTDFGTVNVGDNLTHPFTIFNTGVSTLNLTNISLFGSRCNPFSKTLPTVLNLAPNESTPFQVTFTPTNEGTFNCTVKIDNNDSDENPYTFALTGKGQSTQPIPTPPPPQPLPPTMNITISFGGTGHGHVTIDPSGIDCDSNQAKCSHSVDTASWINLIPTAAANSKFTGWSGWQSDCDDGELFMSGSRSCSANFELLPHQLTVNILGQGKVNSNPIGIACDSNCGHQFKGGESVALTAVPAQNWQFKEWQGDCDQTGQVVMDKDKKCQATFISVDAGIDKLAYQDEVTYFKAKIIIPGRQNTLNYQWDFGDGNTANTVMASHTYTTTGTYTVTFTVTDDQGLVGSDTLLVEVKQSTTKVPQEVLEEIAEKGGGRIIIGLNLATQLEGKLSAPAAVSNQRIRIAQVQQQFLNSLQTSLINLPADAKNLATPTLFTTIPYVAMGVNAIQLAHIRENPLITSIEPDKISFPILHDSVPLIGGINAHNNGYSGAGQIVAVLDTGVDSSHPNLAGKVVSEACYSTTYAPYFSTSLCSGGSDEQIGMGTAIPCIFDGCDHGTHVAGIAAANGSLIGVANEANIVAIQVFSRFDDTSICFPSPTPCIASYDSDQIQGLERILTLYGSSYSIASVNMSLGGEHYATYCDSESFSYKAAIDNLRSVGIATIIASGNDGYSDGISFPACISSAISVGATDKLDNIAIYPGWWGSNSAAILDLLAPGSNITSTIPGGTTGSKSGTSMAAPHVAGAWAVLKAMVPTASVDQVLTTLETTGKPITDPRNSLVRPRIQVDQALVELPCNSPTIRSQANGQWTNPSTWNPSHQPNSTDIVLVEHNIEVNTVPAVVRFLCNKGQLASQSNTSLEIQAIGGIKNVGNILGDRDVILKTATVIGNYDKAGDFWWYTLETTPGPIFNKGDIRGGDGDSISNQGGNVILLGRNITNTGNIQGGKGSNVASGSGGKGGTAQIFARFGGSSWGNAGNLISSGSILAGDGGNGGSSGGRGGNLWLVGYPHVYLGMSAEWKDFCFMCSSTGVANHSAGQGGSPAGEDGWVMIEPSSINIAAGTTIQGGDITIFGGDAWTLKLSEEPVVESSGDITLAVGNKSVVDLTKNTKTILKAANQVNIFADEIRTDTGITLTNLIEAGSGIMTKPSKILYQFTLASASYLTGQPGETIVMRLTLINNGPTTDTYHLTNSSSGSWRMGQLPAVVEVAGLDTIEFGTEVTLPTTLGAQNTITITATSLTDPTVSATTNITVTVGDDTKSFLQEPDDTLSGTVYDQSGAPVAGATLKVGDKTLTTDEDGHWQFDNFAITSGTLYDAQGNPLASATIQLGDQTLTTDANGRWELSQPNVTGSDSQNSPAADLFSSLPPQTPTCYSGLVDWVCNAQGQTLTDLIVGPNGMISSGTLVGTLINQGWVSNLTLEPQSRLTGGIVTGYLTNHGEMADFEFRGAAIVGGTLAGDIFNTSQIGGYFRDVQLAAGTYLRGGQVVGEISGDAQAPALLEDLVIQAGSYLEYVTIGDGVKLAAAVTLGEGVQFTDPGDDPRLGSK